MVSDVNGNQSQLKVSAYVSKIVSLFCLSSLYHRESFVVTIQEVLAKSYQQQHLSQFLHCDNGHLLNHTATKPTLGLCSIIL